MPILKKKENFVCNNLRAECTVLSHLYNVLREPFVPYDLTRTKFYVSNFDLTKRSKKLNWYITVVENVI